MKHRKLPSELKSQYGNLRRRKRDKNYTLKIIRQWQKKLKDTNKWKHTVHLESEELILLKCLYYPKPGIDSMQFLSIKSLEINPHIYSQVIFDIDASNTQ